MITTLIKSMSSRRSLSYSFAVVKSSFNPQRDFRESMVEMIMKKPWWSVDLKKSRIRFCHSRNERSRGRNRQEQDIVVCSDCNSGDHDERRE